jgi:hypothetical protein
MRTPVQPLSRSKTPSALWEAVVSARRVLADRRRLPPDPLLTPAREALLGALEGYAASLVRSGRPIPCILRDGLRIQERTLRPLSGTEALSFASAGTSGALVGMEPHRCKSVAGKPGCALTISGWRPNRHGHHDERAGP